MRYILLLLMAIVLVGCGDTGGEDGTDTSEESQALLELRNVDVKVEELDVLLVAEVKTGSDEIFYRIEQGENVLQEDSTIELTDSSEWKSFEIEVTLPDEVNEEEDAPIIVIYGKGDKGDTVNPNYIPVDIN